MSGLEGFVVVCGSCVSVAGGFVVSVWSLSRKIFEFGLFGVVLV